MRWLTALLILAGTFIAGTAHAKMMRHTDLASLAYESDAIVMARRVRTRAVGKWEKWTDHEVIKVYRGPLASGDHVEVDYESLYNLTPRYDGLQGTTPDGGPRYSDVVVMFLVRDKRVEHDGGSGSWQLATAGLRIMLDGAVHRFEQWNNPGGFEPVPQGHDPGDIWGDERAQARLDWPAFEEELSRAILRADEIRAALPNASIPATRARLLTMLGPATTEDDLRYDNGFPADTLSETVIARFAELHDLDAVLQGLVRARMPVRSSVPRIRSAEWCGVARDVARPASERVAAIHQFSPWGDDDLDCGTTTAISLLDDPNPDVRVAALGGVHAHASRATGRGAAVDAAENEARAARIRQALAKRLLVEADPFVRVACFDAARYAGVSNELRDARLDLPLVGAHRRDGSVVLAWAWLGDEPWRVNRVLVTAQPDNHFGGPRAGPPGDRRMELDLRRMSGSMGGASIRSKLAFDPPLALGRYTLTANVALQSGTATRERQLELGVWNVTGSSPPPPPAAENAPEVSDASTPPPAPSPPAPVRCGCATSTGHGGDLGGWLVLAFALSSRRRRAFVALAPSERRMRRERKGGWARVKRRVTEATSCPRSSAGG